jgi:hypothetical protein
MRYSVFLAVLLAGCATSPETYQQRAASLTNAELCFIDVAGAPSDIAYTKPEIQRRSLTCTSELVQIGMQLAQNRIAQNQAQNQARANALSNLGQSLSRMGAPTPIAPLPLPVNCRTVPEGNGTTRTTCY